MIQTVPFIESRDYTFIGQLSIKRSPCPLKIKGFALSQFNAVFPQKPRKNRSGLGARTMERNDFFNAESTEASDDLYILFGIVIFHVESAANGMNIFPENFDSPFDNPDDSGMSTTCYHRKTTLGFYDKSLLIKNASPRIGAHLPQRVNIASDPSHTRDFDKFATVIFNEIFQSVPCFAADPNFRSGPFFKKSLKTSNVIPVIVGNNDMPNPSEIDSESFDVFPENIRATKNIKQNVARKK